MTTKPLPTLASDEAAGHFVATADLSEYDLSGFKPIRFEIAKNEPTLKDELHAMIAAITPENQHREIDSGLPVGHEAL